ncbi:uncharacterized protein PFL1_06055 [Pseudozyma flocculosa PF-1]|uniref:Uncharacterized protein n=2 Tax=Pseudozyma flocculosa TaxID=84751 RepID=A0A5C3F6D8_9BASI|nr:uncharacterized protein PFL1_06055 [Pseudozyma flocculosa PF-1]EPQ26407.1 hypothetical protein PFL1_06055 [Pseudozyma flocculosa PF-1]SPO38999.1 uncharacterized protein PSFLO_04478 [Pseudozyma flocculosa]
MSSRRAAKTGSGPGTSGSSKSALSQAANTLQALHQEAVAQATALTMPKLSSHHSDAFLRLAAYGAAPESQPAPSFRHRRGLWGDDVPNIAHSHQPNVRIQREAPLPPPLASNEVLPEWFDLHNGRCPRCRLPRLPGVNCARQPSRRGAEERNRSGADGSDEAHSSVCGLCQSSRYRRLLAPPSTKAVRRGKRRRPRAKAPAADTTAPSSSSSS